MPRELKKRGRRQEDKERKRKAEERYQRSSKRFKYDHNAEPASLTEIAVNGDAGDDFIGLETQTAQGVQEPEEEVQFHGLLDPEEQEYYANVNNKIVANDFESLDDRAIFIEAVHRETQGKELKVASSQSCSRYLEKIIMLSTPNQLRRLFNKFLGNLTYLVRHRFGSHCCETLFLEGAKYVGKERETYEDETSEEDLPSLEELFLQAAEELEPNMGFLLTERFASHTVRVLFLILSGEPLDDSSVKAMLASKKKEKLEAPVEKDADLSTNRRFAPKTFHAALDRLISSAISALDTTYVRALATHPTGNPVLQLLLRLELSGSGKNKQSDASSVFKKLLPDDDLDEDSESAKFISGLIYDPTGSHLVEAFVQELRGKTFKKLYKNILKPRLCSMAKNDVASYVVTRILERLGKDDLAEAKELILSEIPVLISRRRTGLVKVLVERCSVRRVDLQDVSDVLKSEYGYNEATFLQKLLDFEPAESPSQAEEGSEEKPRTSTHRADVHGSLLAQAILQAPKICTLVQDSLLSLESETLIGMARNPASSRVVQKALDPTDANIQFRRHFVPQFFGHMATLAEDLTGSYVADALWAATENLHFMKERLAKELASNESRLRASPFGRNVWKNWAMDSYQRRPGEWQARAKGHEKTDPTQVVPSKGDGIPERKKTAIELARERHAQKKSNHAKKRTPATSANAVVRTNA